MAKKSKDVVLPAPECVVKSIVVDGSLQDVKPVITFIGDWSTKDVKSILRAMPRAYRLHQLSRRKQGDLKFSEEGSNA